MSVPKKYFPDCGSFHDKEVNDKHVFPIKRRLTQRPDFASRPIFFYPMTEYEEHLNEVENYNVTNVTRRRAFKLPGLWASESSMKTSHCNVISIKQGRGSRKGMIEHNCGAPKGVSGGGLFFHYPPNIEAIIGVQSGYYKKSGERQSVAAPITEAFIEETIQMALDYEP